MGTISVSSKKYLVVDDYIQARKDIRDLVDNSAEFIVPENFSELKISILNTNFSFFFIDFNLVKNWHGELTDSEGRVFRITNGLDLAYFLQSTGRSNIVVYSSNIKELTDVFNGYSELKIEIEEFNGYENLLGKYGLSELIIWHHEKDDSPLVVKANVLSTDYFKDIPNKVRLSVYFELISKVNKSFESSINIGGYEFFMNRHFLGDVSNGMSNTSELNSILEWDLTLDKIDQKVLNILDSIRNNNFNYENIIFGLENSNFNSIDSIAFFCFISVFKLKVENKEMSIEIYKFFSLLPIEIELSLKILFWLIIFEERKICDIEHTIVDENTANKLINDLFSLKSKEDEKIILGLYYAKISLIKNGFVYIDILRKIGADKSIFISSIQFLESDFSKDNLDEGAFLYLAEFKDPLFVSSNYFVFPTC